MVKTDAAESKDIYQILLASKGHAPKTLDPTIPIMQLNNVFN